MRYGDHAHCGCKITFAVLCPQINSFVKAHTSGRIPTVLTQGQMASVDVGLLINVVFFKVLLQTF